MVKTQTTRLMILLVLVSLLLSACNSIAGPAATEEEIVFNPPDATGTAQPTAPIVIPTLRPVMTRTPTPESAPTATATNTLDPFMSLLVEGQRLRNEEQFDASLAKIGEAIQMDANSPKGYIERGITYVAMKNLNEAMKDFNKALELDPNSVEALNARGNAWTAQSALDKAIADYDKALEIDPNYVKAYTNRAITQVLQGKYEGAIADFTKAIDLDPENPEGYFNRGQAYITAFGKLNDEQYIGPCTADFSQAIALAPDNPELYYNRGLCYTFARINDNAMADFTKAISLKSDIARFYLYRALLYPEAGTQEQALADAQKVLELAKDEELRQLAQQLVAAIPLTPMPTVGPTTTPTP